MVVWDPDTGRQVCTYSEHGHTAVYRVAWHPSPGVTHILTAGHDGAAVVADASGKVCGRC